MVFYWILAALVVAVDQVVKFWIRASILPGHSLPFLPGLMDLTYVQNTGAAFSLFSTHTWLLSLLSAVMSLVFLVLLAKKTLPHWTGMLALSLLLGGAIGNLIDRVFLHYVTDMFATTFIHFAVFNVADIAVVLGGILLCINVLFFPPKEKEAEL